MADFLKGKLEPLTLKETSGRKQSLAQMKERETCK